ncbi:MAG: hypothetical protein GXY82_06895 [Methanospirillum sp.]|nr:hypothetical protein [Methanospirillum sp.]
MIIRVMGEGQYLVDSSLFDVLNEIDNRIVEDVTKGDGQAFRQGLDDLIGEIRRAGKPVAETDLIESDVIVPPANLTLAEAREVFQGTGVFQD